MLWWPRSSSGEARPLHAAASRFGLTDGYIEEMISGQKVVKVFCHEPAALAAFDELNGDCRPKATKAQLYSGS